MFAYLIHYWEIALKWKNRSIFEKILAQNIQNRIKNISDAKVERKAWKLLLLDSNPKIKDILIKIPGIINFSVARVVDNDINEIQKIWLELIKDCKFDTFRLTTKRANKNFEYDSMQINQQVWWFIVQNLGKKVNLDNPELTLFIEVWAKQSYMYFEKIQWIWWLPIWTSWKVVCLISWWIDSPVAWYLMMKRWCEIILVHAFNKTLHPEKVRDKIYKLAKKLSEYQPWLKLYMLPYQAMQQEIVDKIPEKQRMIMFKRSVLRTANMIAQKEKAKAIVLWDALAQVASQTLDNINVIYQASELAVLSPLISFDKQQIVDLAEKIWTYEISIIPYEDCCSLISSKNPQTKSRLSFIRNMENRIDYKDKENEIIEDSFEKQF